MDPHPAPGDHEPLSNSNFTQCLSLSVSSNNARSPQCPKTSPAQRPCLILYDTPQYGVHFSSRGFDDTKEQGTSNCDILVAREGGSGDPRRKWKEIAERERDKKCCFCLQNDLKEPKKCKKCTYILPLKKPGSRHLLQKKSNLRFKRKKF